MKIVILHGTKGSPKGNWFQWLKSNLETKGHNVYVPRFPTPENQSVQSWCKVLDKKAPRFDEDTIIIGHSCGATYLLNILEVLSCPIHRSIFVSGFLDRLGNKEFDDLNADFINHDFNWNKIIKNAGKITILHGDNDPYVPLSQAEKLSEKLKSKLTIIENGGHLNTESGYTEFPELLEFIF